MGIECAIYPALRGDNVLGRALHNNAPEQDYGSHTVIIDATSIIQGSLINVEGGSFGRVKAATIGSMVDLIKRYPNVSSLVYLCDTSIRVPCAKSVEHTEERGRTAYTAQELIDMNVLVPRFEDELSEVPSYYDMSERFPLDEVPPGWDWKKAWHTAPTRRRMESTLGETILDAAASAKPPPKRGWACTQMTELEEAVALGLGLDTHHALTKVPNGIRMCAAQSGPVVYVDMTLPEAERAEVYRPIKVVTGADPKTGAPIEVESIVCLEWNDLHAHPARRLFMGKSRDTVEYVNHGPGGAGEFDLRALDWISPAYGDGMVIYSDDSDMVPIVLLHLMRLECARLGFPLARDDAELYRGWFPRRVTIDRTCNNMVRRSEKDDVCRWVDLTDMFHQLMYNCTSDDPQRRAEWCVRRISAFTLALILCGTDYCPRLGTLFKRMHLPDDGVRRNPNFVLNVQECINLAVRTPLLMACVETEWRDGVLHSNISPERLLYLVLQMTSQAVAKSHKRGQSLSAMGAYNPSFNLEYIHTAWDNLHKSAVPPPGDCTYVSVPTFDTAYHQCLRWMWNYFYWRDGFKDETPYWVTRWMPVKGMSTFGWQLGRVATDVNLLDISQYVFPMPEDGQDMAQWPVVRFELGASSRLAVWRTCRQYGTHYVGEHSIGQFRKEASSR